MMNQEFAAWLKSENKDLFSVKVEFYTYLFLRLPKRPGLDYLYAQREFRGDGTLHAGVFEFMGIYNAADGLLYNTGSYCMDNLDDTSKERTKDCLFKRLKQDVREMVEARVGNDRKNLEASELSDAGLFKRLEQTQQYYAAIKARDMYLAGKSPKDDRFECSYTPELWTEDILLDYIAAPADYAKREAERYWKDGKNQEEMLVDFLERDALTAEYEKIMADAENPVHTVRRIMEAVKSIDAKTVNVTIYKDGEEFSFKTEAHELRRDCKDYYGTWNIAAADRRRFEARYGRSADYCPQEIIRITYGRKTLYEADTATKANIE